MQRVSCRCKRAPSELFFDLSRPRQPPLDSSLCAASHNLFRGGGSATERIFKYTCPDGSDATCGRATLRAVPPGIPRQWRRTRGTTAPGRYIGSGLAPHRLGRLSLPDRSSHKPADVYYPVSWLRRPLGGIVMQAVLRCLNVGSASTSVGLPSLADWGSSGGRHVGGHACRHQGNRSA